jgi:hypothetical protein
MIVQGLYFHGINEKEIQLMRGRRRRRKRGRETGGEEIVGRMSK